MNFFFPQHFACFEIDCGDHPAMFIGGGSFAVSTEVETFLGSLLGVCRDDGSEEDFATPNNGAGPASARDRGLPFYVFSFAPLGGQAQIFGKTVGPWAAVLRPIFSTAERGGGNGEHNKQVTHGTLL